MDSEADMLTKTKGIQCLELRITQNKSLQKRGREKDFILI